MTSREGETAVPSLTKAQSKDIFFLVLAFSCVVAAQTLIIGTGAKVVQSIGGDTALGPFSLAAFFLGMSVVSLTLTHWVFESWGRQIGFWCGCILSQIGVLLSCIGLFLSSTPLIMLAYIFLGAGSGIGMYLRFAAIELVPVGYQSRAVTWVLCGGCLAAFAGPEAGHAVVGSLGEEHNMKYFGVFVIAGCFFFTQAILLLFVGFPPPRQKTNTKETEKSRRNEFLIDMTQIEEEIVMERNTGGKFKELCSMLKHPDFILPVFISTLTWAVMSMPMSIFRVAMTDLGYTSRDSLTVIESHFVAMYSPGFFSGTFIQRQGTIKATIVAVAMYLLATCINVFLTKENNGSIVTWYLGMILLGIGWNFGFSGATVWVTRSYTGSPHMKGKVQAANEFFVFFFSGALVFSTGYIYQNLGGGGISGWRTLNNVVFGLVSSIVVAVAAAVKINRQDKLAQSIELEKSNESSLQAWEHEEIHNSNKDELFDA